LSIEVDPEEIFMPKRRRRLLKHFGSLDAIQKASAEALTEVEGISQVLAAEIRTYFDAQEGAKGE
jgi:excinuclease UvrABC nuclease subunit